MINKFRCKKFQLSIYLIESSCVWMLFTKTCINCVSRVTLQYIITSFLIPFAIKNVTTKNLFLGGICLRHTVTRKLVNVGNLITLVRFNLILREPADLSRLVNNYLLFYYFLQLFLFEQEQWCKAHTEMKLHTSPS